VLDSDWGEEIELAAHELLQALDSATARSLHSGPSVPAVLAT
jgi:hypothetical protein